MKQEHYKALEERITAWLAVAENQQQIAEFRATGRSDTRVRWDVLWQAVPQTPNRDLWQAMYSYLNDDHIDTALKKLIPAPSKTGKTPA